MIVAACGSATPTGTPLPAESGRASTPTALPTATLAAAKTSAPSALPTAPLGDGFGRWESAGALSANPLQTHVVAFGDGALVVGSDNVCTPGAAWGDSVGAQVWSGGSAAWDTAPSLPRARDRFVAFSLPDGSALVVGGLTDGQGGPKSFRSTYRLAPGATEWTRSTDLNSARSGPAGSVLADGRFLVAGGWYSDMPEAPPVKVIASAELFEPATQAWIRTGSMIQPRLGASAATLSDGRVLLAGGWGDIGGEEPAAWAFGFGDQLASAEIFDPRTGTFTETKPLPWPASWSPLVPLPGGHALIVSGDRAARFDGGTGQWAETPPMHLRFDESGFEDLSRGWTRTAVGLPGGEVLVAGGTVAVSDVVEGSTQPYSNRAEIYDPIMNDWIEIAPMPVARAGAAGVQLRDGSVLIAGGAGVVGPLGDPYCPGAALEAVRFIPT